jgi:hypothetical protein
MQDARGHNPVSYAAARYGPHSDAYMHMAALARISGLTVDEPSMQSLFEAHSRRAAPRHRDTSQVSAEGLTTPIPTDPTLNGGWPTATLLEKKLRGDPDRCDILEVCQSPPPPPIPLLLLSSSPPLLLFSSSYVVCDTPLLCP